VRKKYGIKVIFADIVFTSILYRKCRK